MYYEVFAIILTSGDLRVSFCIRDFAINLNELAQKKKTEKCAYCTSTKVTHPKTISIKKAITAVINPWSSSNTSKIKIERCECVCCCKCGASYQKMKMNNDTSKLINSLIPLDSALQDFKNIFNASSFDTWKNHIIEIVEPAKNSMHIIIRLCRKKAYIQCQKLQGRFVIVAVQGVY